MITVFETLPFNLPIQQPSGNSRGGGGGDAYTATTRRQIGTHGVTDAQYQFYVPFLQDETSSYPPPPDPQLHPKPNPFLADSVPHLLFGPQQRSSFFRKRGSREHHFGAVGMLLRQISDVLYLLIEYVNLLLLSVDYLFADGGLLKVMSMFVVAAVFLGQGTASP